MKDGLGVLAERARSVRGGAGCGRYAPSPTGELHLGNLRTALVAWLQARLSGGAFILRMEDLDLSRTKAGSAAKILHDLQRLGLDWDEGPNQEAMLGPYSQSQRGDLYEQAFQHLKQRGLLFPCFCSRKDIQEAASAPHGAGPVYPGTCRNPGSRGEALLPAAGGATPAWRFTAPDGKVGFHDCLHGMYRQNPAREVGDFVVKRRDGVFAYQLAVVVDDALMGVTDVVRGEDLLESTPRQIVLQAALGLPTPRYWHVGLVRDGQGQRLSKRDGSASLDEYLAAGGSVESLVGEFAAQLSLVEPGTRVSARELLDGLTTSDLFRSVGGRGEDGDRFRIGDAVIPA